MSSRPRKIALGACLAALACLAAAGAFSACGSSGDDAGYQAQGPDERVDGGGDAKIDLHEEWPDGDTLEAAIPEAAPTFDDETDAGGDAGPPPMHLPCDGKSGSLGDTTLTMTYGGLVRTALVHTPDGWQNADSRMLVLNFHGFTSDGLQEEVLSRMNGAADEHGFVVVYPYGVAQSWNAGKCCGDAWTNSVDDVGFVRALLYRLESDYCIDDKRVYATGMSNGGFLSHRLGCEVADRFAAIAPVAGVMGIDPMDCKPPRPVPVIEFHGTKDPLVPYDGGNPVLNIGVAGTLDFPSVADTVQTWRTIDGCAGASTTIYQNGDATCVSWAPCSQGSDVVLCTIDGGGHTWPGGVPIPFLGYTSSDISATETMVSFFYAHPM